MKGSHMAGVRSRQRNRIARGLGVVTLMGTLAVVDVNPVGAAFPGRNGPILCTSSRDGNQEIYSFSPDGSVVRRLTNNLASDLEPTLSPDGTRIAFTSTRS